jgi:F-type H+-transporting ATPase subunit a
MRLSPDEIIFWQYGFIKLNATIVFTWALMLVLVVGSLLITHRLSRDLTRSRWQNLLEILVTGIESRSRRSACATRGPISAFSAPCFCLSPRPAWPPSSPATSRRRARSRPRRRWRCACWWPCPSSASRSQGLGGYLKSYMEPTFMMLPFNIISEVSRTLALAVRLFGNMMSGAMIIAILLTITPFIFPILMTALGLLTGLVQAYIFSILAAVYTSQPLRSVRKPQIPARSVGRA